MNMIYRESGYTAKVELLKDETTEDGRTVELKILQIAHAGRLNPAVMPKEGERITRYAANGEVANWNLEEW